MAIASIVPKDDAATHVKFALFWMLVSSSTFLPTGMSSSGVISSVPDFHFTSGMGEPTATHSKLKFAPSRTSFNGSGNRENVGGTRRSLMYKLVGFECSVPIGFSATHSNLPWSSRMLSTICKLPVSCGDGERWEKNELKIGSSCYAMAIWTSFSSNCKISFICVRVPVSTILRLRFLRNFLEVFNPNINLATHSKLLSSMNASTVVLQFERITFSILLLLLHMYDCINSTISA